MSINTAQLPTLSNTPRDQNAIAAMGVFGHRKLAESLNAEGFPLWTTEMEKSAFITADAQTRAQALLKAMQTFDASRGRQPAAAAPQAASPAVVDLPPREPSNKKTKAAKPAAQAAETVDLTPVLEKLEQLQSTTKPNYEDLKKQVIAIQQMISAQYKLMQVLLGIFTNLGQEVMQAPAQAILEDSVATGAESLAFLEKLGKEQGQG